MKTTQLNVYIQFSKKEELVGQLILDGREILFKYSDTYLNIVLGWKQTIFTNCINFEKYFVFLSLGDASASDDKKKSKIYSKESILNLLCFRPSTIQEQISLPIN